MPHETPSTGAGKGTGLAPNIAGLLCYICMPVTSLIFLVIEKDDADVRFHAWQGTILGFFFIGLSIATFIMSTIFGIMPSFISWMSWLFSALMMPLEVIGMFVLAIVCMIKAYQGERWRIPYIGDYAARKASV